MLKQDRNEGKQSLLWRALMVETVVARYKENVDWTINIPKATIYNKFWTPDLPNMGKEAHTYLSHIVGNYNDLAKTTVFVQGDPFPHLPRPKWKSRDEFLRVCRGEKDVDGFLPFGRIHPVGSKQHGIIKRPFFQRRWKELFECDFPLAQEQIDDYNFISYEGGMFAVTRDVIKTRERED